MYEYSWVNFCKGKELKKKVRIVSELTVLKICKTFLLWKDHEWIKISTKWDITHMGFKY